MQKLRILSKDCNFKAVTAEQHREEAIRDSFINGLVSNSIRKRLLEKAVLSLKDAFKEAGLQEHAYQHSLQYESSQLETNCAATTLTNSLATPLPNSLPSGRYSTIALRAKNLPLSCDDVRTVIEQCQTCAELKSRFFRQPNGELIKATQPFERVSMDFKGPLTSVSRKRYLLTIIDEFSRFPFAFPDMSSSTVVKCLNELFAVFGFPAYVHNDRVTEVQHFLHERGIGTSSTTPYSPRGNGQIERLNRTLWKAITLALHSKELYIAEWELVLNDALQSIRSLLCTSNNRTPHERLLGFNQRSGSGTSLPTWLKKNVIV
ncbi:uncharacterized protein LOC106054065 [Biomphalaria glabrata]|uniref:Uncharacterized protein LOC106054065 n=1 Tax=Biomphalaria glabrata TaxID=6526 RepID=A0A9W3A8M0_BIOGL|nr:uncharacterized protein LOC106054065 [Biomphalaria glabrata]